MPSSVRDGVRPSAASMRAYSSAVRLCCFSSSGEMLAGAGTAESVLVVMAMDILSHDQRGLKGRPSGVSGSNETIDLKPQVPEPQMVAEKARGQVSFEMLPLANRISKIRFGKPDHNQCYSGMLGRLGLSPGFPYPPVETFVVRAT